MSADVEPTTPRRTTIEWYHDGEDWRATEPAGSGDVTGTGSNPREAVRDYLDRLEARTDG